MGKYIAVARSVIKNIYIQYEYQTVVYMLSGVAGGLTEGRATTRAHSSLTSHGHKRPTGLHQQSICKLFWM